MTLTKKRQVFVEEYLKCWNATEAARRAGYAHPNVQGPTLVNLSPVAEIIQQRIDEKAMSADEVLIRLGDMARGDMADFLDISSMSFQIDLKKAQELGLTHLIKKVKQRSTIKEDEETHYIELDLHDAQSALEKLGRFHKLFVDRREITGKDGGAIPVQYVNDWRNHSTDAAPGPKNGKVASEEIQLAGGGS